MGEVNKKYNRRISRPCPVCGGRVVVGHRTCSWWVYCEENDRHIPQRRFSYPQDAIYQWNLKANRVTNADRIRSMSDEELAKWLDLLVNRAEIYGENKVWLEDTPRYYTDWLDWLRKEGE